MVIRRRAVALACAGLLLASSTLRAQPREQVRRLSPDEKKELASISAMLGSASAPANDLGLTWVGSDLLKAQGTKEYVPFTVAFDPSGMTGKKVSVYWRVVPRNAPPPDPKAKDKTPVWVFENLHSLEVQGTASPFKVTRSFVVAAGDYDVYVVAKEPDPRKKSDPPARIGFLRQPLTVPDLWNGELNTSSVIVADRIDPLPAPLSTKEQDARPYALGTMELVPASSTKLSKRNELSVFLLVYNARVDAANAPDVMVEYNFFAVQNGTEKFFNKTNPQALNGQTLPPGFDTGAGLTNGQTVPLASFPEGDYRLEIKVTDKLATKSLTRDVKFSVAGS